MINAIKKDFASKLMATTMAATAVFGGQNAAFANDSGEEAAPQEVQNTHEIASVEPASTTPVNFLENAGYQAREWREKNPGLSVTMYVGTDELPFTFDAIMDGLTQDIMSIEGPNGEKVENVEFFFTKINLPGTAVRYGFNTASTEAVNIYDSRLKAKETAKSYLWQQSKPAFAYQYD